jgi:LPXTG-motif cell wall-anchored protein
MFGFVGLTDTVEAKTFTNAYVSFEISDRWECRSEGTEWVCRVKAPGLAEAMMVLTAKEVGPQDSFPAYESHLRTPRTILTRAGQSIQSTIYTIQQRKIGDHPWVDGMHFSSEVYNYYTRYLVTIKERIGVLVTFSAHKLHYTKYSQDFFRAIESLRVIAQRTYGAGKGGAGLQGAGGLFGAPTDGADGLMPAEVEGGGGQGDESATQSLLAIALIAGGAGLYLYLKRRKKKE